MTQFEIEPNEASPSDLRWQQRYETLQMESLDRVRAVAEKWTASIGALFGLFGALLIVKGRTDISLLSPEFELAVGILLGVGLIVAATAIGFSAAAAQGTPKDMDWPSGPALREWTLNEAKTSRTNLFVSRLMTALAMALVLAAIGLTWFGETDATGSSVVVTNARVAATCGELELRGSTLTVRPTSGNAVDVTRGATLTVVPKCP